MAPRCGCRRRRRRPPTEPAPSSWSSRPVRRRLIPSRRYLRDRSGSGRPARCAGGKPVALVRERPPSTGPTDSFEELLRIDLRDQSRTVVVRRSAWESGHEEARLLPNGDVVGLIGSEGGRTVVRWRPGTTPPLWSVPVAFDPPVDLAVRGNSISTVERATARDGTTLPLLMATFHELPTGRPGPPARVAIVDPGRSVRAGLFCPEWISPDELLCARRAGPPIAVDVRDGSSRDLPGGVGAVATVLRG